ncbi:type VI secretion system protein ImpF [Massilia sp. MP_M2]|uniref:type VI secretion system baseplate subunit TssE n=1 Tax=Massilia sp. MP_M2 TaxID=3071713 RepID=UPI00319E3D6B
MVMYTSSVWDRLIAPIPACATGRRPLQLTLAQYKLAIARDLEALLNTRVALTPEELATYPACRESIVNFGLADFAQLCLTSSSDRKKICDLLTAAIVRNEPRLAQVRARLVEDAGRVNRLSFAISGQLRTLANDDRVQFDILLEPSSLQYAIR